MNPLGWLTQVVGGADMAGVTSSEETQSAPQPVVALCVDGASFDRFGRILRHLVVGLVDQAMRVQVISTDPHVEALAVGPVRTLVRPLVRWPFRKRRIGALIESLSPQPPTIIHALAYESYEVAFDLAEALDADLVLQVTALADCDELMEFDAPGVQQFLVSTPYLGEVLQKQSGVIEDVIATVRPGILVEERLACFAQPERAVTLVCTSPLERDSGVDLLIEAVHILRQRGISLMAFLLGQGSFESSLRRAVHERNLSACVVFARPLGDYDAALLNADILVRPTADVAFSVDTLQAMSAGLVVVTLPSRVCDYLRDGETAVLCSSRSAASIAQAVEKLIEDRAFARGIAQGAMEYVKKNHSISAMAERTAQAYRALALARSTFSMKQ